MPLHLDSLVVLPLQAFLVVLHLVLAVLHPLDSLEVRLPLASLEALHLDLEEDPHLALEEDLPQDSLEVLEDYLLLDSEVDHLLVPEAELKKQSFCKKKTEIEYPRYLYVFQFIQ